jgi:MoxR-like ATPase
MTPTSSAFQELLQLLGDASASVVDRGWALLRPSATGPAVDADSKSHGKSKGGNAKGGAAAASHAARIQSLLRQRPSSLSADAQAVLLETAAALLLVDDAGPAADLLAHTLVTRAVVHRFRPALPILLSHLIDGPVVDTAVAGSASASASVIASAGVKAGERFALVTRTLCRVLLLCPHLTSVAGDFFRRSPFSLFDPLLAVRLSPLTVCIAGDSPPCALLIDLPPHALSVCVQLKPSSALPSDGAFLSVAQCADVLMRRMSGTVGTLWNWAPVCTLLASPHTATRVAAGRAVAGLLRMNEPVRNAFFRKTLAVQALTPSNANANAVVASSSAAASAASASAMAVDDGGGDDGDAKGAESAAPSGDSDLESLRNATRIAAFDAALCTHPSAPLPPPPLRHSASVLLTIPRAFPCVRTAVTTPAPLPGPAQTEPKAGGTIDRKYGSGDVAMASAAAASSGATAAAAAPAVFTVTAHSVMIGGIAVPARPISGGSSATAGGTTATAAIRSVPMALVNVASTRANLSSMGLALCQSGPILVEGDAGSGKTSLIGEVARVTGHDRDLIRIHLDDSMDSKTVVGTYSCTDIPGQFAWQPGALTRAVLEGRWALIEDIDRAPFEVLSAVLPLLERGRLFVPGRGQLIEAAPGFRLWATRTTGPAAPPLRAEIAPILHAMFARVVVRPLSGSELAAVLSAKFPAVRPLIDPILQTVRAIVPALFADSKSAPPAVPANAAAAAAASAASAAALDVKGPTPTASGTAGSAASAASLPALLHLLSRPLTVRDVFKWCERLQLLLSSTAATNARAASGGADALAAYGPAVIEQIFLDATDSFVAALSTRSAHATAIRTALIDAIARAWGVSKERVDYYAAVYKPRLATGSSFVVGRVQLSRDEKAVARMAAAAAAAAGTGGPAPFSMTKHSLRLMERLAGCVRLNEAVLLVGETGTGKTSVIQHMAQQVPRLLRAVYLLLALVIGPDRCAADASGACRWVSCCLCTTSISSLIRAISWAAISRSICVQWPFR